MSPARARRPRSGHTLLEMTISLVLSLLLVWGFVETVGRAASAYRQVLVQDIGTRVHQRVLGDVRDAAFSAVRVLGDDDVGRSLLAAVDTTGAVPLAGTRLPVLDTSGRLAEDVGEPRTGNALLLVVESTPVNLSPAGVTRRIDVVRLVAFYVTRRAERVLNDHAGKLDLVQFTSVPYVLRSAVDAIRDASEREATLALLRDSGYDRVITLDVPADQAFHEILPDDTLSADPLPDATLEADLLFPTRRLLAGRAMSVAPNSARLRVPRFALPDAEAPEFPSGFEVKVAGPWAAARMLVRLALVTGAAGSHDIPTDVTKVMTVGAR